MNRIFFALLLLFSSCCKCVKQESNPKRLPNATIIVPKQSYSDREDEIYDLLKHHFDNYRIEPSITVKNVHGNQTHIQLSNHIIEWIALKNDFQVRIDNALFSVKNHLTLNTVWEKRDSTNYLNDWDEIKLFDYHKKEFIIIRTLNTECVGIGCSVNYFIVYDVTNKTANYFGTFRTDHELELFDFRNDNQIDYVAKSFIGDNYNDTTQFIYQLFSRKEDGKFALKKDPKRSNYEIKLTTFYGKSRALPKLEEHWVWDLI